MHARLYVNLDDIAIISFECLKQGFNQFDFINFPNSGLRIILRVRDTAREKIDARRRNTS